MTLGNYIEAYRKEHNISQRAFAKMSRVSNGYISMLEHNRNPKTGEPVRPTMERLDRIAATMGLTVSQLLQRVEGNLVDLVQFPGLLPVPEHVLKPRLGVIACGAPIPTQPDPDGDADYVPASYGCDFTLLCKGDSMEGAHLFDGDVVMIRAQPEAANGAIAAVQIEGEFDNEVTLKRVRYANGGIVLWPENSAYTPLSFTGAELERVRILGVAVGCIRRL